MFKDDTKLLLLSMPCVINIKEIKEENYLVPCLILRYINEFTETHS